MKAIIMLFFIITMNVSFFLVNTAMVDVQAEINPLETANSLFDKDSSMMSNFDTGNYTLPKPSLPESVEGESVTESTDGNIFTDTWKTLTNAFTSVTQWSWVINLANSVPIFLTKIKLPVQMVWALGFIWHTLFLFSLVLVLTGRGS